MHTRIPMHAKVRKETQIETHIAMEAALVKGVKVTLAPWTLPLFDISSVTRKRTFIRNYRYNR